MKIDILEYMKNGVVDWDGIEYAIIDYYKSNKFTVKESKILIESIPKLMLDMKLKYKKYKPVTMFNLNI